MNKKNKFITLIASLLLLTSCSFSVISESTSSSSTSSDTSGDTSSDTSSDTTSSSDDTSTTSSDDDTSTTGTDTSTSSDDDTSSEEPPEPILPTAITMSSKSASVFQDQSIKLSYTLTPSDATCEVTWTAKKSYFTVDQNGLVTGVTPGKGEVVATTSNGLSATCMITVKKPAVTGITLNESNKTIYAGDSFYLNATVSPENAGNKNVIWTSNNENVATVDLGSVTGVGKGSAVITATTEDGGFTATCNVTVQTIPVTGISLNKTTLELEVDRSETLQVSFTPSNASDKRVTWTSSNPSVASVSDKGVVLGLVTGNTVITAKSVDGNFEATCSVTIIPKSIQKVDLLYDIGTLDDYSCYGDYVDHCPSTGSPKLLIIPVWFTNSSTWISSSTKKTKVRDDIRKAYLGTTTETGWHSVSSYYTEESGGACNITGTVTDWWECGKSTSQITSTSDTVNLVKSAVTWYFGLSNHESKTSFDTDKNGYLDGVILIYGSPDSQVCNSMPDEMWAYCYYVQNTSLKSKSNPGPNVYFWASFDFMYGDNTICSYYNGDTSHCNIDAHTFIHEMGHVLGLNDYYDYNNVCKPAGAFSMQDYNVGGHDPYSLMVYGWAKPYAPTDSCTIEITPFQNSKDIIVLSPNFHKSPFDEYIIIELYTPTGLNEFDSLYKYDNGYPQGPNTAGIRIWHVDARLYRYGYGISSITYNPTVGEVDYVESNTYYKSGGDQNGRCSPFGSQDSRYYDYNELQLIRNNTSETYRPTGSLSSNDLFKTGSTFSMSKYAGQFRNSGKFNSELDLGFSVSFTSVTSSRATVQITKL